MFKYFSVSHTIVPIKLLHSSRIQHFKTVQVIHIYFPKCSSLNIIKCYIPNVTPYKFLQITSNLVAKRVFLLKAGFIMAKLD